MIQRKQAVMDYLFKGGGFASGDVTIVNVIAKKLQIVPVSFSILIENNKIAFLPKTVSWNRDVNSTLNMLKCVYYMKNNNGSRPPYMTRPTTNHSIGASCSSGGVSASDHTVPQSIYSGK